MVCSCMQHVRAGPPGVHQIRNIELEVARSWDSVCLWAADIAAKIQSVQPTLPVDIVLQDFTRLSLAPEQSETSFLDAIVIGEPRQVTAEGHEVGPTLMSRLTSPGVVAVETSEGKALISQLLRQSKEDVERANGMRLTMRGSIVDKVASTIIDGTLPFACERQVDGDYIYKMNEEGFWNRSAPSLDPTELRTRDIAVILCLGQSAHVLAEGRDRAHRFRCWPSAIRSRTAAPSHARALPSLLLVHSPCFLQV